MGKSSESVNVGLLNLRQLRAELKKRGLSPSGLKGQLVKRLRNYECYEHLFILCEIATRPDTHKLVQEMLCK
jgi:hypothetical protein